MIKNVNIVNSNHKYQYGIEDIISIVSYLFKIRGINVEISDKFSKDKVNIIIDEFTSYGFRSYLKKFKKINPSTKVYLISTEFVTKKNFFGKDFETFNYFDKEITIFSKIFFILVSNFYQLLKHISFIEGSLSIILKILSFPAISIIKIIDLLNLAAVKFLKFFLPKQTITKNNLNISLVFYLRFFTHKFKNKFYLYRRYIFFKDCIDYLDGHLLLNNFQKKGFHEINKSLPMLGIIHPEFDTKKYFDNVINKKIGICMSGTITNYRLNYFNKLKKIINNFLLKRKLSRTFLFSFSGFPASDKFNEYLFSFHPPQTQDWISCSPTRLYRAFAVDFNIPVITKNFGHMHIERLCVKYDELISDSFLNSTFGKKLSIDSKFKKNILEYSRTVKNMNDLLVTKICE